MDGSSGNVAVAVAEGTDALWLFESSQGVKYLAVSCGIPGGTFSMHLFKIDDKSGVASISIEDDVVWNRRVSQVAYDDVSSRFVVVL